MPIQEIEENFLHRLNFNFDASDLRSLTLSNIKTFGKQIKQNNGNTGSDLLVGLTTVSLDYTTILTTLERNSAFLGKYLSLFQLMKICQKFHGMDEIILSEKIFISKAIVFLLRTKKQYNGHLLQDTRKLKKMNSAPLSLVFGVLMHTVISGCSNQIMITSVG